MHEETIALLEAVNKAPNQTLDPKKASAFSAETIDFLLMLGYIEQGRGGNLKLTEIGRHWLKKQR